jgi:hypothetical protein
VIANVASVVASSRRASMMRGAVAVLIALACNACGTDDSTGDPQALIVTGHCAVTAMGVMPGGEGVTGAIHDDGTGTPTGSWQSSTTTDSFVGTPDWLECRVNGSTVADFTGTGSWNGAPGYPFRVHVQDRGTSGAPVRVEGPPTTATLTATHTYSPPRSTDGSASWDAGAYATVPASLPVTVGNAGNGWAWITFAPEPDATASLGYEVRCRYRGGARSSSGCRGRDLTAGESYAFVDCQRPCATVPDDDDDDDHDGYFDEHHHWHGGHHGGYEHGGHFYSRGDDHHRCGRDDDHDTWCTDPALLSGAQILVSSATLHVDSGATDLPSRRHAQTTVTVALDVTPFVWSTPENDFYRLAVWDPSGALVHSADGDLSSGDVTVTLLP